MKLATAKEPPVCSLHNRQLKEQQIFLLCSFWSVDPPCGAEGVGLKICSLLSCTRDIESHWLVSLGLGRKRGATGSKISEVDLILNRAGKFDVPEDENRQTSQEPYNRLDRPKTDYVLPPKL